MSVKYYHDEVQRIVYKVWEPSVVTEMQTTTKRRPRPKALSHHVSQDWEITRADNWLVKRTNQWKYNVRDQAKDSYDADRDSEDKALGWFKPHGFRPEGLKEISGDEYKDLRDQYENEAKKNTPEDS